MDIKGTKLSEEIATATNDKIEEIRKNIFSIYAKEFNLKRKCDKNNVTEAVQTDKGETLHNPRSTQHQQSLQVVESVNNVHVTKCENSSVDDENQNDCRSPESETEHTQRPETESRSSDSVANGRSPIRVNTTSFSVADILDPGKFTGVKLSPKGSWHPWLQRGDRELGHEDSDDECMIDESGKPSRKQVRVTNTPLHPTFT